MKPENDSDAPMSVIVRQGANAFWDDDTLFDNPYEPNTQKHSKWAEGWTMAKLELNQKAQKKSQ